MLIDEKLRLVFIDLWEEYLKPEYENGLKNYSFYFFTGGRGIGKTYSMLRHLPELVESSIDCDCEDKDTLGYKRSLRFIYMRRTKKELEKTFRSQKGDFGNPFKKLNDDFARDLYIEKYDEDVGFILSPSHPDILYGYAVCLPTISDIRGISLEDCDILFYDEFVREKHKKAMRGEYSAFMNAIETIGRNREMLGRAPLMVICCSNSENIANEIYQGLGVVSNLEKAVDSGKRIYANKHRSLYINHLETKEAFLEAKAQTALYRLTAGTNYYDVALGNNFANNDFSCIAFKSIKGMRPVCCFDGAYIYQIKGRNEYYVTYSPARCVVYKNNLQDRKQFCAKIGNHLNAQFIKGMVTFESYELKSKILQIYYKEDLY